MHAKQPEGHRKNRKNITSKQLFPSISGSVLRSCSVAVQQEQWRERYVGFRARVTARLEGTGPGVQGHQQRQQRIPGRSAGGGGGGRHHAPRDALHRPLVQVGALRRRRSQGLRAAPRARKLL